MIAPWPTEKRSHRQVRANETYLEAECMFCIRNRDVLTNTQSLCKWWSTLKSAVFGFSLPPLVGGGGGLVCESVGKADLLSDNFDIKQSKESLDLPLTCHPSPCPITFAFRSSELIRSCYLDTWSGFIAAKTVPWPSRELHHCGKFLEPSDE